MAAYTEGQVSAWFVSAKKPIEVKEGDQVIETADQRLARLVFQLNAGTRTEADVKAEIMEGVGGSGPEEGGTTATALLQEVYGGSPEIWYNNQTKVWYLVYGVPGTTVPLMYTMSVEQLKVLFPDDPPKYDRSVTASYISSVGGIMAGTADDPFGDPYAEFIEQLETEAQFKPWLKDDDMLAIMFEAALEGRTPTQAEVATTEWWQTHNARERAWLESSLMDPMTAKDQIKSAQIQTKQALEQLGMASPPTNVVNYIANMYITGAWSEDVWAQQMQAIADPYSKIAVDKGLKAVIGSQTLNTSQANVEAVREMVRTWLGPVYGNWSDTKINEWAGKLRNDPDAKDALTAMLRGQRSALFPEYTNADLTYDDIAGPWANLWENTWRQPVNESDPLFMELLHANDYELASQKLRAEGLNRNVAGVTNSLGSAGASLGQQTRTL